MLWGAEAPRPVVARTAAIRGRAPSHNAHCRGPNGERLSHRSGRGRPPRCACAPPVGRMVKAYAPVPNRTFVQKSGRLVTSVLQNTFAAVPGADEVRPVGGRGRPSGGPRTSAQQLLEVLHRTGSARALEHRSDED